MAPLNMDEEALLAEICKEHRVPQMVLTELLELERDLLFEECGAAAGGRGGEASRRETRGAEGEVFGDRDV